MSARIAFLQLSESSAGLETAATKPVSRRRASVKPYPDASDWRIEAARTEMQDFLNEAHPSTDAEALQTLRVAFPAVPLSDRIAAIRTRFFA